MTAITQISRIQHRTGLYRELPSALNEAELGWALDTRQLFIGNGPIHPGNTEIITQHTPASSYNYSYRSPIAYQQLLAKGALVGANPFTASTGLVQFFDSGSGTVQGDTDPTTFNPTIRSFQEKFDDIVSIKDYMAVGDGQADDTGSLIRAAKDLYSEEFGAIGDNADALKRNVAIYLPGGVYRIRKNLIGFPGLTMIGDPGKTIILLDIELSTDDENDAVLISADSYGQIDFNMGNNYELDDGSNAIPSIVNCEKLYFYGISFQSNQASNVIDVSKRQIVRLARTTNATFEKCTFDFVGATTWQTGDSVIDASTAILVTKLNDTTKSVGNLRFINCTTSGAAHDFNFIDGTSNVTISGHSFNGALMSCKVGSNGTYDSDASYRHAADSIGSINITIRDSVFNNYTAYALSVYGAGESIKSFGNRYNGTGKSIRFGSTTKYCSSISDWFANTASATCGTANPRIDNLSLANTIFNSQDFLSIPIGLLDLNVCGNIIVSGSVIISPQPVTNLLLTTIAYPSSSLTQPNSFKGNSVHVNYSMRIPNGGNNILRTGTLQIIYFETSPNIVDSSNIQFSDDYTEVVQTNGDPNALNDGIGLTINVIPNNANQNIEIRAVSSIGTPTSKVIINAVSI